MTACIGLMVTFNQLNTNTIETVFTGCLFLCLLAVGKEVIKMANQLFQTVKQNVTARMAAERYGLKPDRSGMVCCPFHADHIPSMKVDERFYCFGCGASGDVIDLAAGIFHLGSQRSS